MKGYLKDIAYILAALILLNLLVGGLGGFGELPGEAALHIAVTTVALVFALLMRLFVVRREVLVLLEHSRRLHPKIRNAVLAFLLPRLRGHLEESRLLAGEGISVAKVELEVLVDASFNSCKGSYQGTDRHPPSGFVQLYPTYLTRQVDRQVSVLNCDTRFLLVPETVLQKDHRDNKGIFQKFVDSHNNTGILLLQAEPEYAEAQADNLRLSSTEVGVFGWDFVVFYTPPVSESEEYSVRVLPLSHDLKKKVAHYFVALNDVARRVDLTGDELRFIVRRPEDIRSQRKRMFEHRDWPPGMRGHR